MKSTILILAVFCAVAYAAPAAHHGGPHKNHYPKVPLKLDNEGWTPLTVIEHVVEDVARLKNEVVYTAPTPVPVYVQPAIKKRKSAPIPAASAVQPVVRRKKSSPIDRSGKAIAIVSHNKKVSQQADRAYHFDFKSENGITRTEDGYLKPVDTSKYPAQVMSGSYSYTGPDGNVYTITYIADENGFRAEGAHLPVPVKPIV